MSDLVKKGFMKRVERLEKVQELLDVGHSQTQAADMLNISPDTISNDIKILEQLRKGSLSPELCAEKRIQIEQDLLDLIVKGTEAYEKFLAAGDKAAADFFKSIASIHKYRAKMWGLENISELHDTTPLRSLSLTKANVTVTVDKDRAKEISDSILGMGSE